MTVNRMSEGRLAARIARLLEEDEIGHDRIDFFRVSEVEDFAAAGIMTSNAGLVVTIGDGAEFQVTIVRSKA